MYIASIHIILCRQRATKVLIKPLCRCTGWSAPLLFAYDIKTHFRMTLPNYAIYAACHIFITILICEFSWKSKLSLATECLLHSYMSYMLFFASFCYWDCYSSIYAAWKNEPPHDKTNKLACAPSEDSDQPGHPPSLISLHCPHEDSLDP